jgi:predicted Abi (CAAX) family protease
MTERDWQWLEMYVAEAEAADKMRADMRARWDARPEWSRRRIEAWSFYDREVNRHHSDFDRENYGL